MTHDCSNTISLDMRYPFDARGIAKRFRHAAIFGALDALNAGETMRFLNDHDPLPLLMQLQQQPLSREHHTALKLAKECERVAPSSDEAEVAKACRRAIDAYESELEPHFAIEERTLLPLLNGTSNQPLAERTLADHRQLRALLDGLRSNDAEALGRFGRCLTAHVRFEERELFPVLESRLPQ